MARPLRIEFPGAVYHITSRGNAREAIALADDDREDFIQVLRGQVLLGSDSFVERLRPALCDKRRPRLVSLRGRAGWRPSAQL